MQDGATEWAYDLTWNTHPKLREASEKQLSQKVEKVHNFLDPPSPWMSWTFSNLGKIRNLMTPPLRPNWEKFEIGKILEFWEAPSENKT